MLKYKYFQDETSFYIYVMNLYLFVQMNEMRHFVYEYKVICDFLFVKHVKETVHIYKGEIKMFFFLMNFCGKLLD